MMGNVTATTTRRVAVRQLKAAADGTLGWRPGGLDQVKKALAADLMGPKAGAAIDDVLKLMVVLRGRRNSPEAAAGLQGALRSVPGAVAAVRRRHLALGGLDQQRTFAQREGRDRAMRAPLTNTAAPEGSLPLKSLLDPGRRDRAQEIARRRKEIQDERG